MNDDPQEILLGNDWISSHLAFHNNLATAGGMKDALFIWVRDFSGKRDAVEMIESFDHNGYCRADATHQPHLVEWWRSGRRIVHESFVSYRRATGQDRNSVIFDGESCDILFTDSTGGDFSLTSDSPARAAGRRVPPDIASAIGIVQEDTPNLGALLGPGGYPVSPE